MVYIPVGKKFSADLSFLSADQVRVWWFDPRKGEAGKPIILTKGPVMSFTPPALGIENDWVLIVDDASTKFLQPGK